MPADGLRRLPATPAAARLLLTVLAVTAATAGAATADPATCVTIAVDAERLACYDRALGRAGAGQGAPAAERSQPAPAVASTAKPAEVPRPVAAAAPSPQAPAMPAPTREAFGQASLPAEPASAAAREPDRVEASVVGHVDSLAKGQELLLDNGQRWRSIDDRELDFVGDNPRVTLWRNLIGSYWLRFEPRGPQLRVRRVQ